MKRFTANPRHQVTASYFFFASTWILATDIVVEWGSWSTLLEQSTKGLFFVAITTALLSWLLRRHYGIKNRADQERDDALAAYTDLFEQQGLPQLLIDPASGHIVKANGAASAYYGWTVSQLCTMPITAINTLSEAEVFAEMANARLQRRNYFRFCHRLRSGEVRQVEVFSHPVKLHGRPLLYSLIVDISQQQHSQLALERSNRLLKSFVFNSVREYDRVNTERLVAISRVREALFETVAVLSETVETRDPYTAGHQRRVAWLAVAIGQELGLSKEQLEPLNVAALLHDIGKIAVPAELLAKPGKLSPAEFELIKQHPKVGEDLLKKISFAAPIAYIVGQHHERLDGTGYPLGLSGEHILLEARIISVADVVEAMISHRPYRAGLPLETACAEIQGGRGSKYDGAVVDACLKVMHQGGYEVLGPSGEVLDRAKISIE